MRLQQAKEQFEKSGLGGMVGELGKIGSHVSADQIDIDIGLHLINIKINHGDYGGRVSITTTADGTISIEGDDSHHTTLSRDEWQGGKGTKRLEQALKKAYKHPDKKYRSSSYGKDNSRSHGRETG